MFKLDLEKEKEPEIKWPAFVGSSKKKRVPEEHLLLLNDYTKAFDSVDHNKQWKILKVKLQQYVNQVLPDVQGGFRKGRGTRDQIANIHWITEKKQENTRKNLLLLH